MKLFAPARIHLGFLELDQKLPRFFGSIGLTISNFGLKIEIRTSRNFKVTCKNKALNRKIKLILNKFNKNFKIEFCELLVYKEIPLHVGLGSGTQIALTVGFLISEFNSLSLTIEEIALFLKRGNRSGVGIQSFKKGGFSIDIGKKKGKKHLPLELVNIKWPEEWKVILLFDSKTESIFGEKEITKFKKINKEYKQSYNDNYATLIQMIIPGIIEKDFYTFSKGVNSIQGEMSKVFYGDPQKFSSYKITKIFNFISKKKNYGFGQTSWGPTGFIFCENLKKRNVLLNSLENYINLNGLKGIRLIGVNGRNKGKFLIKDNK